MKQSDLLKRFYAKGWWVLRQGVNHIIMTNGIDIEPIPVIKKSTNSLHARLSSAEISRR